MHPLVNIAISAARSAGNLIARSVERLDLVKFSEKHPNDFVSEVDKNAEKIIIRAIQKAYPNHHILAEESGALSGNGDQHNDFTWIIDPLDGTTNFLHGFPHFAISIAIQHKDRVEHGVIYDPIRHDLFVASRGQGATCNDRRIRVSTKKELKGSLIGTGFPFRHPDSTINAYLKHFEQLLKSRTNMRRAGSAALDLAYVAAGYLDGFWEYGLQPWDIAAGALMIQEAGGLISDLKGNHTYQESGDVVAGNPKIFKALLRNLNGTSS